MAAPIKVLIAEDHALLVDALRMLLGTQADMHCVGVARDGEQALSMARTLQPDILLLDIGLPRLDGLSVVEGLRHAGAKVKVLIVTARLDPQSIRAALGFGAAGYLPKDEDSDELLLAIRRVAEGRRYISAAIAQLFLPEAPVNTHGNKLTASESTVLQLVGEGLTSKEISRRLDISEATARKHRENIRRKLGIRNSAEMAAYAIRTQAPLRD
ncbi:response regulator transcription factor [Uliginosibacterium sp. TH139]|uniref:response regulator n=1 Tax=Uliginosibacterium sp. TH139 TaxID=2067453 RepID=UPI000C79B7A6|nr:response regulator transcription factor [Uliginosibacterium sp. TH139]PLK50263.1 DNA-binding response regulator [Uliginosibacterium sp. TH139]